MAHCCYPPASRSWGQEAALSKDAGGSFYFLNTSFSRLIFYVILGRFLHASATQACADVLGFFNPDKGLSVKEKWVT